MTDLTGRIAMVTGGSRGIGRAAAVALAKAGCDVAINYREHADDARETVWAIEAAGRKTWPCRPTSPSRTTSDGLLRWSRTAWGPRTCS